MVRFGVKGLGFTVVPCDVVLSIGLLLSVFVRWGDHKYRPWAILPLTSEVPVNRVLASWQQNPAEIPIFRNLGERVASESCRVRVLRRYR